MSSKSHWENVYEVKAPEAVSWFQPEASRSLALIQSLGLEPAAPIIDVGGGASTLVDKLLEQGFTYLTVLDIAESALGAARRRLGERASAVRWICADITQAGLPAETFALWHDRAVFHFLTTPEARAAYVVEVSRGVKPGGHVIIATFADDGPLQCSGLPVVRYTVEALAAEFGEGFSLVHHEKETHRTPWGSEQSFVYCVLRK